MASASDGSRCLACGVTNRAGVSFCGSCGALLRHPEEVDRDEVFQRPTVITLLAVLDLVGGGLTLLVAALVVLASRGRVGPVVALVLVGLGVLQVVCGVDVWRLRPSGRVLQMVLAAMALILIPIGTLLGIAMIVYLARADIKLLFSGRMVHQLSAHELGQLHRLSQAESSGALVAVAVAALVLFLSVPMMGIVAAIAIPNLLNAINRGRVKRTVADMQVVATRLEEHRLRTDSYPEWVDDIDALAARLEEHDPSPLPRQDGWRRPLVVLVEPASYELISLGRDGVRDQAEADPDRTDFDTDIVLRDGEFVQGPAGLVPLPEGDR